jgi:hypothetical protein
VGVWHQKKFEEELEALGADAKRLDDAMRGVEEQLAEDPSAGIESRVPGMLIKRIKLPGADGSIVRASILYTFDGKDVTYQSIKRRP